MDLSAVTPVRPATPRGPLSLSKRQRRIDNNLCLYAGCTGHVASDCPVKRAAEERRTMLRSVTVIPASAPSSGNA